MYIPACNENRRTGLCNCKLKRDENTVDCDRPDDTWEKHGLCSVDNGNKGFFRSNKSIKKSKVIFKYSWTICGVVKTWSVLPRINVVNRFACQFFLGTDPPSFRYD